MVQSREAQGVAPPGEQARIRAWFDDTYRRRGANYLRPPAAYPIYLQLLEARAGQRLLDVGCGPGLLLEAAVGRGLDATGLDLSNVAVELAKQRVPDAKPMVGNAEALDFEDGTFDFVTCIGSIERMIDRGRVLREMLRVAKPSARFCFLVRNSEHAGWRFWHKALGRRNKTAHQDALTLESWTELFEQNGMSVDAVLPDQWPRQRMRRWIGRSPKPGQDERVFRSRLPMRWALEFLFLLSPADGSQQSS